MKKVFILCSFIILPVCFLIGQSIKETQDYIIDLISENNKDYKKYEFKRDRLILYRKPYLATFTETIYFRKADFAKEYLKEKVKADDLPKKIMLRNWGMDGAYWIYSKSGDAGDETNLSAIRERVIFYGNSDGARRLVNAFNHLAKISKDPFD